VAPCPARERVTRTAPHPPARPATPAETARRDAARTGTIITVPDGLPASWRARLAGLRMDLTPLRTSRDFRVLCGAGFVFYLGMMVGYVAVPFQLYALTGSNFAVGAFGLAQLVPLVLAGLYGGALADRLDRRRVLLLTGVVQLVGTAALLANAATPRPSLPVIYAVGVVLAVAQSVQSPSREALVPRTVRHAELPAAVALSSVGAQVGMLAGPALGGLLLASAGAAWAYGVTLVGSAAATALYARLRPYPPLAEPATAGALREIRDGLVYAVRRPDLLGTYVVDLVAMFLAMPIVLFPALAADVLHRPTLLGLLYTAGTVGSLLATATSGWTARVHHHGRAVVLAAAGWGASVALAGLTTHPAVVLLGLVLAGAFDMISGLFRATIWHQTIPDSHRGRLAGIELLSYSVGPLGGEARAGLVADATSVRTAIVSGGVLCVAGVAATAAALRTFWAYDARTDEHAVRERMLRAEREGAGQG
jgi:MFS family permease